jgi:hypothetical protein
VRSLRWFVLVNLTLQLGTYALVTLISPSSAWTRWFGG